MEIRFFFFFFVKQQSGNNTSSSIYQIFFKIQEKRRLRFAVPKNWNWQFPSPQNPFVWWENRFHRRLASNNSPISSSPPKSPNRRPSPRLGSGFRRPKLRPPIASESSRSRRSRRRWRRRIGFRWPMWCRTAWSGGSRTRSRRPTPATRRCRSW